MSPTFFFFFFWRIHRYVLAFFSWCLLSPKGIQNNDILPISIPCMYMNDITRICSVHVSQQKQKRKTHTTFFAFFVPSHRARLLSIFMLLTSILLTGYSCYPCCRNVLVSSMALFFTKGSSRVADGIHFFFLAHT